MSSRGFRLRCGVFVLSCVGVMVMVVEMVIVIEMGMIMMIGIMVMVVMMWMMIIIRIILTMVITVVTVMTELCLFFCGILPLFICKSAYRILLHSIISFSSHPFLTLSRNPITSELTLNPPYQPTHSSLSPPPSSLMPRLSGVHESRHLRLGGGGFSVVGNMQIRSTCRPTPASGRVNLGRASEAGSEA